MYSKMPSEAAATAMTGETESKDSACRLPSFCFNASAINCRSETCVTLPDASFSSPFSVKVLTMNVEPPPAPSDFCTIASGSVSYTHLRAHETRHDLVCRLLLEK